MSKKLISIILVIIMMLSITLSVFANEITIVSSNQSQTEIIQNDLPNSNNTDTTKGIRG